MQRTKSRTVTIHIPDGHKPPRERCSGLVPQCSINHYVSARAIDTRGTWPISHMVSDAEMAGLAILYRTLGGSQW